MTLATIYNQEANEKIGELINQPFLDYEYEESWIGLRSDERGWSWTDKIFVDYLNWENSELAYPKAGNHACASVERGTNQWHS